MNVEDALPQGRPVAGARPDHASTTIQVRGLVLFAAALIGVGIGIQLLLGLVMRSLARSEDQFQELHPGHPVLKVDRFPTPRLQEHPAIDLERMREEERRRINVYGWVDPKAGIAHIPIHRAMDILARTGLPKVPAPPPVEGAPPGTYLPPPSKREEAQPGTEPLPATKPAVPRVDMKQGREP
jgi:hypothetical protein